MSKSSDRSRVLDHIGLDAERGTIMGLVGENGTDKSTMMRCLFGAYQKDEGNTFLNDREISFPGPKDALENGIAMVHQELDQCPERNVADNLFLGHCPVNSMGIIDEGRMKREIAGFFKRLGITVNLTQPMSRMSVSWRQMHEIAKAISYNSRVITLDKSTPFLTVQEINKLSEMMRMLKEQGITLIYISHRMDGVFGTCDEIPVLQGGDLVMTKGTEDANMNELITAMVDRPLDNRLPSIDNTPGDVILSVQNLFTKFESHPQDVSFNVKEREVLGLYSLVGTRRTELLETISGVRTRVAGRVYFNNHLMSSNSAKEATEHGFAMITEGRKVNGLFLKGDLTFNTTVANLRRYISGIVLSDVKVIKATSNKIKTIHTKCMSPDDVISSPSGGNQQKVIFGKWLERSPQVFMTDESTRGINMDAKYEIYEPIINMVKQGRTIIVVSSETPEIPGITNCISVMPNGCFSGIVNIKETSQEGPLRLSAKYLQGGFMNMAKGNNETLTAEQEMQLRQPIEDYVGGIQKRVDSPREDGTSRVVTLQNGIDATEGDRSLTKEEREDRITANSAEVEKTKAVETKDKDEIAKLIPSTGSYLKAHLDKDHYLPLKESCEREKALVKERYDIKVAELNKERENTSSRLTNHQEIKDKKYVYRNRLFDAKMDLDEELQRIKDRRHAASIWQYHLVDMLRLSKFTFMETRVQKQENCKYIFDRRTLSLQNSLYIAVILIFIGLYIAAPVMRNVRLLTYNDALNILQQASPRMPLALGIAGFILLIGTDLSIERMVGMGMTIATIIMHQGTDTGAAFGHVFDSTGMLIGLRVVFALVMCIILYTCFTAIGGFFTAKFKMYPFISVMADILVIFGLVTCAIRGVSFGATEPAISEMIIPKTSGFPTIILWVVAAIVVVWFIWNETAFGKDSYTVSGNPGAVAASGISVFGVTMGAFILAGIPYGFGSWLGYTRVVGFSPAAYGQGWEVDAITAYVVDGVFFAGGIGKISGVVVGVLIFTVLIYSLTILDINTDLQFIFEGIITITAMTLDCLKYTQKK